jgi:hypothetical protein
VPNGPPVVAPAFQIHPLAEIFPLMNEKEFEKLVADIKTNGVIEALWMSDGKVIDGRNRLRACQQLGITPSTREWDGKGSLLEFIISLNLHRRHLKERQRAMIAARMKPAFEEEAQRRKRWASTDTLQANLPEGSVGQSRDHAASLLSVSGRSVDYACRVLANGIPALITAVDSCKLAVSTAADLAELPHGEQEHVLAGGREAIRKALQPIRAGRRKPQPAANRQAPPAKPIDPALEKKMLNHFNNGWVKLTRSEQGFRMQFCEYYLDELQRAMGHPYFKTLMEHGVMMVKVEKGAA